MLITPRVPELPHAQKLGHCAAPLLRVLGDEPSEAADPTAAQRRAAHRGWCRARKHPAGLCAPLPTDPSLAGRKCTHRARLRAQNTGVIGGALLYIVPEFGLASRPEVTGLIASSTTMGAMAGTFACGKLLEDLGRQRTLVVSCALFFLGGLLMGWSPDTRTLIAGRIVGGVAAGLVSAAVPTYIAECAAPSQRGALSTLPQLCVSGGILLSYLVGLFALLYGGSWRGMLGFSLVPACLQAAFVLSLPESPRWLLSSRQDQPAALAALKTLRGTDDVAEEFEDLKKGLAREMANAESATSGAASGEKGGAGGGGVLALFRLPDARRALAVCAALQLFQQFSGVNAIVYFTPQILKQAGAPRLFDRLGVSADAAAMLATVLAYLPKIPSVLLAAKLIDSRGRRWMLLAFIPPLALCLGLLALTVGTTSAASAAPPALAAAAATAAVTLYGIFFGMSLGPLPNILAAEAPPPATEPGTTVAHALSLALTVARSTRGRAALPHTRARRGRGGDDDGAVGGQHARGGALPHRRAHAGHADRPLRLPRRLRGRVGRRLPRRARDARRGPRRRVEQAAQGGREGREGVSAAVRRAWAPLSWAGQQWRTGWRRGSSLGGDVHQVDSAVLDATGRAASGLCAGPTTT
jgi:SP family galactose:H+ symporter-like MFS transporter